MKNKKRLGFLSAILGVCISATAFVGNVAFAEGEDAEYGVVSGIVDIADFKNKVDYFTKNGKVMNLAADEYKNFIIEVKRTDVAEDAEYSYAKGIVIYGEAGTYDVTLFDGKGTEDKADDVKLTESTSVKVVDKDSITNDKDTDGKYLYRPTYDATNLSGSTERPTETALEAFKLALGANVEAALKEDKASPSIEIPKSFWNVLDLGVYESTELATKVYLAKPKTDFSVINSSWKSGDMSKITVSANGTYAFYVEIRDYIGNEIVVDKETMQLRLDADVPGWYSRTVEDDPDTEVDESKYEKFEIPVFSFQYVKETTPVVKIEAKQKAGIIGVEYNSGRITTENIAKSTIKLYYNADPNATLPADKAEAYTKVTSGNGWAVVTSEQATISGGSLSATSLKFTPLVKGAYAYVITAVGSDVDNTPINSVSEVVSVTQTVQAQKLVNVKFRNFVKTNWLSLVFLGIAFLCVIGIIVLAFYKPKDAEEIAAKKAKKEKVEDSEEVVEAEEEEEVVEAEEVVEEAEETPAEEAEEVVEEIPAEDAPVEETPVEEAPAEETKPE